MMSITTRTTSISTQLRTIYLFFLVFSHLTRADRPSDLSCSADRGYHRPDGGRPLTPDDLPPIRLFQEWQNSSVILEKNNRTLTVSSGTIRQAGYGEYSSDVDLLSSVASRGEIDEMLEYLNQPWLQSTLDQDPDTVDGFATQEFFLDNDNLRRGEGGKEFESPATISQRAQLRAALQNLTRPILDDRITPYVNQRFPEACQGRCTPCYSLIRRYIHGERQSHAPHRDGHAIVTAVVSLSDYGEDYLGGLYVASESGRPYYLGLSKGDAAVHQSDLLHGVKVHPIVHEDNDTVRATRWSWILWFMDSHDCADHSYRWFADCAAAGNPTCALMHATKIGNIPGMDQSLEMTEILKWNEKAAELGHATACVKLARALLGMLPSPLEQDPVRAKELFQRAIDSSNDPDAHYGLASMYLFLGQKRARQNKSFDKLVRLAVAHLEASALGGHPFAMFNLGIAHAFGYADQNDNNNNNNNHQQQRKNPTLAGAWFEASGLPEGLAATSFYYASLGDEVLAREFQRRAQSLGFGQEWRVMARQSTGYGGAGGIDLNLHWPPNAEHQLPPQW